MKMVKMALFLFIFVIVAALLASTIYYHNYTPKKLNIKPDEKALAFYRETYDDARALFRSNSDALAKRFNSVEKTMFKLPSKTDNDLSVDLLYIPAQKIKKGLVIISSGVHGVEGNVGSALQAMLMQEFMTDEMLADTGFLFIHGINPYGFKYVRRTTENNIDLNRNCLASPELYQTKNEDYPQVIELINPQGKVKTRSMENIFFHLRSIKKIATASMPVLRQAVLQGQYEYPQGLYYGGAKPESQIVSVTPFIKKYSSGYRVVLNLDLHTGYGENGTAHLFTNPVTNPEVRQMMDKVFEGYKFDWGDTSDFYTITGDFTGYVGKIIDAKYLPMGIEYGTLDSQNTFGSIISLQRTLLENQGYHHGYASEADERRVKEMFREMYYPSCTAWRTKVILDTKEMLTSALNKFKKL